MSSYGVTTARAHLDALDLTGPVKGEIDWNKLAAWVDPNVQQPPRPAFAGRYFGGSPTAAEIDARTPFCLWGHAEGGDLAVPRAIVPLQRADPARQSTPGDAGQLYGGIDAAGVARYLDQCLAVGDLASDGSPVLVFLEVADGAFLSAEYWYGWARELYGYLLYPAPLLSRDVVAGKQMLLPALLCSFEFDADAGKYLAEPGIRTALGALANPALWFPCFGFWARRKVGDPALANRPFDWATLGTYMQPPKTRFPLPGSHLVPVYYLRWYEGPGDSDNLDEFYVPDDAGLIDTLSLVTVDFPAEGQHDPLNATFRATDWRPDAHDVSGGPLTVEPVQFGVDTASNLIDPPSRLNALQTTAVHISRLPYDSSAPQTPFDAWVACEFAVRYYSQNPQAVKNLTWEEAGAITNAGLRTAVVWEESFKVKGVLWDDYVRRLIVPFTARHGFDDGVAAFTYAAEEIGQPPFTPIYFAVDFPVGATKYSDGKPDTEGVDTPGLSTVLRYFRDVNKGYQSYLATHPEFPYYIGVYAGVDVFKALYRAGLTTYFWQVPWRSWNNSARPFVHVNLWQIGNFNMAEVKPDIADLTPFVEVDLDVAWGDPGTFGVHP